MFKTVPTQVVDYCLSLFLFAVAIGLSSSQL
jgi:hypothetical protein